MRKPGMASFVVLLSLVFAASISAELQCHCDACVDKNFTCVTNGTCMLMITRKTSGEIKKIRRKCATPRPGQTLEEICGVSKSRSRHRTLHCCSHTNLCNVANLNVSFPSRKPVAAAADTKAPGRPLVCKCDKCRRTNNTCTTNTKNGACFIILRREPPNNEVKKFRRCATGRPGQSIEKMCKNRDHLGTVRYCCVENMCNIDTDVQVPTWEPIKPQLFTVYRPTTKPRRRWQCLCDFKNCKETNFTCMTTRACVMEVERREDGSILKRRRCALYKNAFQLNLECSYNKLNNDFRVDCCYSNMCNVNDIVSLPETKLKDSNFRRGSGGQEVLEAGAGQEGLSKRNLILIIVSSCVVAVCIIVAVICYRRHASSGGDQGDAQGDIAANVPEGKKRSEMNINASLGSGRSGTAALIQQTIMQRVELCSEVGRGKFGRVFRGNYRGDEVAVKVFNVAEEKSWSNEVEIYQKVIQSQHKNILGFVGADRKDDVTATRLYLIMEYHRNGCLLDFLVRESLDPEAAVHVAASVASGLSYLHSDVLTFTGVRKPAIAHRDLKSKNILVKEDGTCCIADFGLAVCKDAPVDHTLVGTKRYLAPEFLDDSYSKDDCFSAYKQRDIYSLGLVLWEVARRCTTSEDIHAFEYQMPFHDKVPCEPTVEDMKQVVCDEGYRPPIPESWEGNEVLCTMVGVMQDCWNPLSEARITALRAKKTLLSLLPKKCLY